jgi:hypothetical protein
MVFVYTLIKLHPSDIKIIQNYRKAGTASQVFHEGFRFKLNSRKAQSSGWRIVFS